MEAISTAAVLFFSLADVKENQLMEFR